MLKRRVAAFAAAIMAAICSLVAGAVIEEHQAALDSECTNLSARFQEGVRGVLNEIAGASALLKSQIEAEAASRQMFDLEGWKSTVPELVSPTVNVTIIDAESKLSATSVRNSFPVSYADRDFFTAHRDNPNLGLFIGKPAHGKRLKRIDGA